MMYTDESMKLVKALIVAMEARDAANHADSLAWADPVDAERAAETSYAACEAQYNLDLATLNIKAHNESLLTGQTIEAVKAPMLAELERVWSA